MRIFSVFAIYIVLVSFCFAGMLAPGIGLRGSYYQKADLSGTAIVKYDPAVNLEWKEDAGPIKEIKPGAFSVQWRGYLMPQFSESYTFTVKSAGGIRLFINNKRVIDDWGAKSGAEKTGTVDLKADRLVAVILQFTHPVGTGSIQLQWSSPSLPIELIPTNRMYPPVFAPTTIVYCDNPDIRTSALYMTDFTDTPKKLTVEGSFKPVFSPDGKKVLFQTTKNLSYSTPGIYRYSLNNQEQIRLTRAEGEKYEPSFSADGRTISFVTQLGATYEIWTMRADGGSRVKLVSDGYENRHPVLNADASVVVYQSKRDGVWNIYSLTISDDGNVEKQLTTLEGTEPSINRRGDKIVFISSRSGRPQLYVMGIDGSNQTLVSATPGEISQPFFTPNRDYVAYLEKNTAGKTDLYAIDIDDKIPCQFTTNGKIVNATIAYNQQLPVTDGLSLWLNAQEVSSLVINTDGKVSNWDDCFRTGMSAVQPNVDRQPLLVNNAINGLSALRFDGIDDFMDTTVQCKVVEMYAVFKVRTDVFNGYKNLLGNKPGYNRLWFLESGQTFFHSNPYPLAVWRNGTPVTEEPYNIGPINEWMILTGDAANPDDNRIYQICAAEDSYFSDFDVAEIVCYSSALSPTDRNAVITSLKAKYGIQ
jgi:hypothetical protein